MRKGGNIVGILFLFIWTGVAILMTVLFAYGTGILAVVPGAMAVFGVVLIILAFRGKIIRNSNGEVNYVHGKSSLGKVLNVWDESSSKMINGQEEKYYMYFIEFEYFGDDGVKYKRKQGIDINVYNALINSAGDSIPIIISGNDAVIDENKIGSKDRFKK